MALRSSLYGGRRSPPPPAAAPSSTTTRRPRCRRSFSADGDAIFSAAIDIETETTTTRQPRRRRRGYGVWIGPRVAEAARSRRASETGGAGTDADADADAGPRGASVPVANQSVAAVGDAPLRAKRIGAVGEDRRRSFSDTDLVSSFGGAADAADAAG
jgi:hypothetical protein